MSEIRHATVGKWYGILTTLGVDEQFLTKKNGPCPMCGGTDRWRWTDYRGEGRWLCEHCEPERKGGDGFDLLMRIHGWDFATTAKELEKIVGDIEPEKRDEPDPNKRIETVRKWLVKSHPDVTAYLRGRGLEVPERIRAHGDLWYFDGREKTGSYPAMVAGVQAPDGTLRTFVVTYLQGGNKAPVVEPRKMLTPNGSLDGAAVRLYREDEHMGVAEGVESAIAAKMLFGVPVWALTGTSLMKKWLPPEGVRQVTVFADNDDNYAGEEAAYSLAHRLSTKGYDVNVELPKRGDFNDVLRERADA